MKKLVRESLNENMEVRKKTYYKIQDIYDKSNSNSETYDAFFETLWQPGDSSYSDLLVFAKWAFNDDVWPYDIRNIINLLHNHDLKISDLDKKINSFKTFKEFEKYAYSFVKRKEGEPENEYDDITVDDLERIFNERDENGNKQLVDFDSGKRYSIKVWLDHMGYTINEGIKEIKSRIKFMDEEVKGLKDAIKNVGEYNDPVAMKHHLKRKLDQAEFMLKYWKLTLEVAIEYKNKQ